MATDVKTQYPDFRPIDSSTAVAPLYEEPVRLSDTEMGFLKNLVPSLDSPEMFRFSHLVGNVPFGSPPLTSTLDSNMALQIKDQCMINKLDIKYKIGRISGLRASYDKQSNNSNAYTWKESINVGRVDFPEDSTMPLTPSPITCLLLEVNSDITLQNFGTGAIDGGVYMVFSLPAANEAITSVLNVPAAQKFQNDVLSHMRRIPHSVLVLKAPSEAWRLCGFWGYFGGAEADGHIGRIGAIWTKYKGRA
jgi:hypothetical protein